MELIRGHAVPEAVVSFPTEVVGIKSAGSSGRLYVHHLEKLFV